MSSTLKTYRLYVVTGPQNDIKVELNDVLETADMRLMREWARQRLGTYRLVMVFEADGNLVFQACR